MRRAATLLLTALGLLASCGGDGVAERPHVVLIVIDTLRADHVFDDTGAIDTPNLDLFAADGVSFERAFSHTSWTLPSHTALFSSRHPYQTGVVLNAQRVPEDLPLLAEWLAQRGFVTEAVVSLCSLIPTDDISRLDRGFDRFDARMQRVLNPADLALENMRQALDRLQASSRPFFLFAHFADPHQPYRAHGTQGYPAEVTFGGEVVGRVDNLAGFAPFRADLSLTPGENRLDLRAERPFSIKYAGVVAAGERLDPAYDSVDAALEHTMTVENPHPEPVEAQVEVWAWDSPDEAEARRRYALEVAFLDRHVGMLLDDLRARGLYDDALIVLTSDHGEGLGEHGLIDHGLNCFDEQLHVPLIVKLPAGHSGRGDLASAAAGLVRHVDVAPTILQVLDLPALPGGEGVSLLESADRVLLAETHALSIDDHFAMRDERWKLLYSPTSDRFLLFDLQADPTEQDPIAAVDEEEFGEWMARLREAASSSPDAGDIDREVDAETRAKLEAMGYF